MTDEHVEYDMNILPFPIRQKITEFGVVWEWHSEHKNITITSSLSSTGEYHVTVEGMYHSYFHKMEPDTAMSVGKAIASAANWINVWKQHAGEFLEREILSKNTKVSDFNA